MIKNPEYKGKWKPKMIANPDYKGSWEHPMVPNPDYKADPKLGQRCTACTHVGFELWQVRVCCYILKPADSPVVTSSSLGQRCTACTRVGLDELSQLLLITRTDEGTEWRVLEQFFDSIKTTTTGDCGHHL